jgi:pimeloyl-ACP methyl ester carboxylesterase
MFVMINHFRKQMRRPLIGIGHSMGGCQIVNLSLMHPRLFTTVILIDPVIVRFNTSDDGSPLAVASTRRRDRWPSRKAAETGFLKSKFYQSWDPRVLRNWLQYGLRDLPTNLYPNASESNMVPAGPTAKPRVDKTQDRDVEVTLTTTKHQEVLSFTRPNFPSEQFPNPSVDANPRTHPDVDPDAQPSSPFYRPEPLSTFRRLPFLRPSALYLFADQSGLSLPLLIAEKMANTGVGAGGSGGVKKGRVKQVTFKGVGHLIPMEVTNDCAEACAEWIVPELHRWTEHEILDRAEQGQVPRQLRSQMSEKYVETMLGGWYQRPQEGTAAKPSKL